MRFIMIAVLIDMMSIGVIVPVLPLLVGRFTVDPTEQALWYGVVAFAYSAANFFGAPILGAMSDRYGRRPVLLLGFCGLALNFFATALATQLWVLVAVRLMGGLMQANAAVANAYVADISTPEQRAKRFGMLGAMFGLGFIIGPVMGGLLGGIDLRLPFFASGVLALLNLLYGYFVLPESLPVERRRAVTWSSANPITSLKKLGQLEGIGSLVLVIALSNLAQSGGGPGGKAVGSAMGKWAFKGKKAAAGADIAAEFAQFDSKGAQGKGLGAARAMQVHPDAGAYAGMALGVQALLASLLIPLAVPLFVSLLPALQRLFQP